MELELKTPQQRLIYQNIWPHPGARFGNEHPEKIRRDDLRRFDKTYAQAVGFSPSPASENWKVTTPWVRDAAERVAEENRKTGIDKKISGIRFLDLPQVLPAEPDGTGVSGIVAGIEYRDGKFEKYIVIALAVIAGILILKIIL